MPVTVFRRHTKPVKEEILAYFQQHCDSDGVVVFSNRKLRDAIQRSIGSIPGCLDQLVAEGKIEKLELSEKGSRIRLLPAGQPNPIIEALKQRLDELTAQGHLSQRQRVLLKQYLP